MTESRRPFPKVSRLRRWGPISVVLVALVAVGVVSSTGSSVSKGPTTTVAVDLAANPKLPTFYAEAKAKGKAVDSTWGNCDTTTGRVTFPSVYAPPCVPVSSGSNGGATVPGVTADTIKIVYYLAPANDVTAALAGVQDSPAKVVETVKAYLRMFESRFETYGRKVEVVPIVGSGIGTDETAARADAVKVATQLKVFASIGGPGQTNAYADELAARHVVCIGCGLAVPDSVFQRDAPYMWGWLQTPEQYLENIGIVQTRQLNHKNAIWAGDPKMRSRERVFGVVRFEQDPPVFSSTSKEVEAQSAKQGFVTKVRLTYLLDLAKLPETASGIVAKLKSAGVTTVTFLGDPIMPIYLTKAATEQDYFPEWFVTGTVLTDTTTLARMYDQKQWAHAFGVSTLPLRTIQANSDPYRVYRWYYGTKPDAVKTSALVYPPLLQLMQGIHMAGPDLTPQTFAGGMFRLPPVGGQPAAPHVSYGNRGLFAFTKGPDFTASDDSTLIWWDATAKGPDEQGTDGTGMYRYVNQGKRYLQGKMPTTLQPFFGKANSATYYRRVPPELTTPKYAAPIGSPAAKAGK